MYVCASDNAADSFKEYTITTGYYCKSLIFSEFSVFDLSANLKGR